MAAAAIRLQRGQRWEFVRADGQVDEYELQSFDRDGRYGSARLRNLKTDGIAAITSYWLLQGDSPVQGALAAAQGGGD